MTDTSQVDVMGSKHATDSSTRKMSEITRSSQLATRNSAIPSRLDNPFATCWTKPGAIAFDFDAGPSADDIVKLLASRNWSGAIIGPHGCGKSTLLESLRPVFIAAGCRIHSIALSDGQWRLPRGFLKECGTDIVRNATTTGPTPTSSRALIVVDGYEQLGWLERVRLKWFSRRTGAGLLVTSHQPCDVPTLIQLSPSKHLVERLVADLCRGVSTNVTAQDVAASYASHGSNVREIFFELYDHHEQRRRITGTGVLTSDNDSRGHAD